MLTLLVRGMHIPFEPEGDESPESYRGREFLMARVRSSRGGTLADVVDLILDKGIVIDAWVRVSVIGIEILTVEARVVVASVDTYLKYADAIGLTAMASTPMPTISEAS